MKQNKKHEWFRAFEAAVVALNVSFSGRIDWDTATFLYNTGKSAAEAASQYVANRSTP